MYFELAVDCDKTAEEYAEYLHDLLKNKLNNKIYFYEKEIHTYGKDLDCIYFGCEGFRIDVDIDPGVQSDYLEVTKEVFDFDANMEIHIEMYGPNYDEGVQVLFQMLNIIVQESTYDFLFDRDGTYEVLKRKDNILYKCIYEWDYYYKDRCPFELIEKEMRQIRADFRLFVSCGMTVEKYIEYLSGLLKNKQNIKIGSGKNIDAYKEEYSYISCSSQGFFIEAYPSKQSDSLKAAKEELGFEGNIALDIQIRLVALEKVMQILFRMIGIIAQESTYDILLSHGSTDEVLKREDNILYKYINEKDECKELYPFELIGQEMEEVRIR